MKLLALDTASARCSVALLRGDVLTTRAVDTARDHATLILPMVQELLDESGIALRSLDGIAFGRGPGSFTGVRVAASVTQGLAAGSGLPVLGISDLRALAAQAARVAAPAPAGALLLAAMDARMGEIYWAVYEGAPVVPAVPVLPEIVGPATGVPESLRGRVVAAAGRGLSAWPAIAEQLQLHAGVVLGEAEPDAADIARLAAADLLTGAAWQDAALAQPVYLRDQVVHVSR